MPKTRNVHNTTRSNAKPQKCNTPQYNLSNANIRFEGSCYFNFTPGSTEGGDPEKRYMFKYNLEAKKVKLSRHQSAPVPTSTLYPNVLRKTVSQPPSCTAPQNYPSEPIPIVEIKDKTKQYEVDKGLQCLFKKSDSQPVQSSFIAGSSSSKEQERLESVLQVNQDSDTPQTLSPTSLVRVPGQIYSRPPHGFNFTQGGMVAQNPFAPVDSLCSSSLSALTRFCPSQ